MTALWIFFLMAMLLYLAISLALQIGIRRLPENEADFLPAISILIAARNEEDNLPRCLEALLKNDYPTSLLEILVIDDRSTDNTRHVAQSFAQHHTHIRVITLEHRLQGMSGKASAICHGMDTARGEIILITDADCVPSPQWIGSMVSGFTENIGMVGGFTMLSEMNGKYDGLISQVQNLDWIYLLSVGAGAAGFGKPVSILGNNFGFRRCVYEAVGGYRRLGFTIIEDCALMKAMIRQTRWRVRFLLKPAAAITSRPPLAWRAFTEQRKRWAAGGKEVSGFGKILLISAFLRHVATVLALVLLTPIWPALAIIALVSLADFLLLMHASGRLRRRDALVYFPFFQLYFLLYSLFLAPVVVLPTTVRWKDVDYHWRFGQRTNKVDDPQVNAL